MVFPSASNSVMQCPLDHPERWSWFEWIDLKVCSSGHGPVVSAHSSVNNWLAKACLSDYEERFPCWKALHTVCSACLLSALFSRWNSVNPEIQELAAIFIFFVFSSLLWSQRRGKTLFSGNRWRSIKSCQNSKLISCRKIWDRELQFKFISLTAWPPLDESKNCPLYAVPAPAGRGKEHMQKPGLLRLGWYLLLCQEKDHVSCIGWSSTYHATYKA